MLARAEGKLAKIAEEVEVDATGTTTSNKKESKRQRLLAESGVLVVNVNANADASEIDRTIASTIESSQVESVVVAGIRSLAEVKRERLLLSHKKRFLQEKEGEKMSVMRATALDAKGQRNIFSRYKIFRWRG